MSRLTVAAIALFLTTLAACGGDSSPDPKPPVAAEPGTEAAEAENAVPSVKFDPPEVTTKVGKEVTLTGLLVNKPASINRWLFSVAWYFGDDEKDIGRPLDERNDVYTETTHAWAAPGTYTVKLEIYGNNAVVAESTLEVVVE